MRKLKAPLLTWEKGTSEHEALMRLVRIFIYPACYEFEINLTEEKTVVTMVFDAEDIV
jgi:hypothetical protein